MKIFLAKSRLVQIFDDLNIHPSLLRTSGDQLEKGRGKFIHTVGAVGKVHRVTDQKRAS